MGDRIHQEVDFGASPDRIYLALTDANTFAEFSGAVADIAKEPGGAISLFGGYVTGRMIELVADRRVVQAWRGKTWEEGLYSIARFELKAQGATKSRIVFVLPSRRAVEPQVVCAEAPAHASLGRAARNANAA